MSTPFPNDAPAQRVDWAALKSFIADKERLEAETGRPAPLSETELSAIAVLLRPVPRPGPEIGGQNWLGLLNHFQQVRSQKVTFADIPREYPRLGKAPDLRWTCTATFAATGDVFPRPDHSSGSTSTTGVTAPAIPDFQKKQDAKQYAAKTACEWLIANGHMLPSGELPKLPKPFAPAPASATVSVLPCKRSPPASPLSAAGGSSSAAARKKQDTQSARSSSSSSSSSSSPHPAHGDAGASIANTSSALKATAPSPPVSAANSAPSTTSTSSSSATTTPYAGTPIAPRPQDSSAAAAAAPADPADPSARILELCARLKYPVPHYRLAKNTTIAGGDFWDGHADFGGDPRVPDDLGVVRKVLTKKAAKERMAKHVLVWLLSELERRERVARVLLGDNKR
ncbi:hypothetical protein CH063_13713 [Colletotrichum higginsianum]|uniref:rRNA-processing protein efg1 n=2 Tax=Colletotrichum higginsianum TaxID=80884 RepID=H1VVJ4_COLHI|nr:rRNA-processing protein efg1 [Colletotrichum higginsianum IMI 349063]OBR14109.1 rRNA-processing protein efg1 [Colletotrichum higginsianum IMI 349063]TID02696.1 hypothetical protein CH35J_004268 [Colletotrichum higginsianum]CCF44254.1 hypothetical protein CH063_13713 [Colletotrichum higginsianum]